MPGLAEYWEFTDTTHVLTTNAAVTNWIGKLQGTVLTNGSSTLRPTNSASGVGFTSAQILTNISFKIGTNYIVSMFYQYTANNLGGSAALLWGSNAPSFHHYSVALTSGGANKYAVTTSLNNGNVLNSSGNLNLPPSIQDIVYSASNSFSGAAFSGTFVWTNGVSVFIDPHGETTDMQISMIGSGDCAANGPGVFTGYIQALYIQTNIVANAVNASNIHYYRTNIFTPGAAP